MGKKGGDVLAVKEREELLHLFVFHFCIIIYLQGLLVVLCSSLLESFSSSCDYC